MSTSELLGMPLPQAEQLLESRGKRIKTVQYESRRGVEGADDWRVLRCREQDGEVELVVSAFFTRL